MVPKKHGNTKKTFKDVDNSGIVTLVGACAKQIAVRIHHESSSGLDTSPTIESGDSSKAHTDQ